MTPKAFWSQVKKQRGGCWLWMGKLAVDGYGIGPGGKPAHRVAWQLTYGEIPKGKRLLHSCHVRRCVKLKHLRPGTDAENAMDTYLSGRPMNETQRWVVHFILWSEKKHGKSAKSVEVGRAKYLAWQRRRETDRRDPRGFSTPPPRLAWNLTYGDPTQLTGAERRERISWRRTRRELLRRAAESRPKRTNPRLYIIHASWLATLLRLRQVSDRRARLEKLLMGD